MWNGQNYLLKTTTDLNYLASFKPVVQWLGFNPIRNPFCIPFPLEEGTKLFTSSVLTPSSSTASSTGQSQDMDQLAASAADGFFLGGGTIPVKGPSRSQKRMKASSVNESVRNVSPYKLVPNIIQVQTDQQKQFPPASAGVVQSFITNNDMARIRKCEAMILIEDVKFVNAKTDEITMKYEEVRSVAIQYDHYNDCYMLCVSYIPFFVTY
jgi:hypothetical protein